MANKNFVQIVVDGGTRDLPIGKSVVQHDGTYLIVDPVKHSGDLYQVVTIKPGNITEGCAGTLQNVELVQGERIR